MGMTLDPDPRELHETGREPDYQVHDIVRYEDAGDGMVRIYISSRRGKIDRLEYSVHCSPETLARLGRTCLTISAEFHNLSTFRRKAETH